MGNIKSVCILTERWANGGIESFLSNVLTHMNLTFLSIDIVAVRIEQSIFTEQLTAHGIQFYELSGNRNHVKENCEQFNKILIKRKYDVIHVNAFHAGALFFLYLAKKRDIKIRIAHSHNTAFHKARFGWLKRAIHACSKALFTSSATDIWACSKAAAEFMFYNSKRNPLSYSIIPNGLDTEKFRFSKNVRDRIRKNLGIEDQILVGHIGRLCYQKNQVFLLSVFAELIKTCPNSRLILVGDGEDRIKLEQQAIELKIKDKVIFLGMTCYIEQILWAMDVFVFPSLFEGLGMVAIEAQSAGLPVICSDQVPIEACVLPSVRRLSLSSGLDKWAKAIEDSCAIMFCRESSVPIIQKSGFDIADVVKQVEQTYLKYEL